MQRILRYIIGKIRQLKPKILFRYGIIAGFSFLFLTQITSGTNYHYHESDMCGLKCEDVAAEVMTTTLANIQFIAKEIIVQVLEKPPLAEGPGTPVANIPAEKIYINAEGYNYTCSTATDSNGKCTIPRIEFGSPEGYVLHVDYWEGGDPPYENVPYESILDINEDQDIYTATLYQKTVCQSGDNPPSFCMGNFIKRAIDCDESDNQWVFQTDDTSCEILARRICPDGAATVLKGICKDTLSGAECQMQECEGHTTPICSFSSPQPPSGAKFRPGDVVTLNGEHFGVNGGEVRIVNRKIFIEPNDPDPRISWQDEKISFVLPYGVQSGTIGVRPEGYDYLKKINQQGQIVFDLEQGSDGNYYKKPIYCYGGETEIAEFENLRIEGNSTIPVSVTGG